MIFWMKDKVVPNPNIHANEIGNSIDHLKTISAWMYVVSRVTFNLNCFASQYLKLVSWL